MVVLTASVGAGHDGPAREIAKRLVAAGHRADLVDLVDLAPAGTGRLLRNAFHAQLAWAPGSWGRLYKATNRARADGACPDGLATLVRPLARPLARIIAGGRGQRAAAVVSTYPLAGHAVAAARRLDHRRVPLISYITDPAAHASWVVPGTDLYLTGWATTAVQLWRHGPAPIRVINPLVRSEFHLPPDPLASAMFVSGLGLPPGRLVLVMSGSWAVGDLMATVDDLLAVGGPSPVVVCGAQRAASPPVDRPARGDRVGLGVGHGRPDAGLRSGGAELRGIVPGRGDRRGPAGAALPTPGGAGGGERRPRR